MVNIEASQAIEDAFDRTSEAHFPGILNKMTIPSKVLSNISELLNKAHPIFHHRIKV